jgi:hypothetical protein
MIFNHARLHSFLDGKEKKSFLETFYNLLSLEKKNKFSHPKPRYQTNPKVGKKINFLLLEKASS